MKMKASTDDAVPSREGEVANVNGILFNIVAILAVIAEINPIHLILNGLEVKSIFVHVVAQDLGGCSVISRRWLDQILVILLYPCLLCLSYDILVGSICAKAFDETRDA